jgi:tRNA 2-thiouridine synthesizing protein B
MGPDLKARGIDEARIIEGIKIVDYSGFVALVAEHDVTQSWL